MEKVKRRSEKYSILYIMPDRHRKAIFEYAPESFCCWHCG